MPSGSEARRRLFFALWPEPAVQARLAAIARQWTRHPVVVDNLHLTLEFLGACGEDQLRCYSDAATTVAGDTFELQLDYLGAWPRRGIQWLGCSHIPPTLPELVRNLQEVLVPCGLQPDKRPFVPHVTLSRREKNPHIQALPEALGWPVTEFALVESLHQANGVHYAVLKRWPLRVTA